MAEQSEAGVPKPPEAKPVAPSKPKSRVRGNARDTEDAAESLYGPATDAAGFVEHARWMIETKPYTAVAIALGLGWLFGRTDRPL